MQKQTDSSNWRATARFVEGMKLLQSFRKQRDWGELGIATDRFAEAVNIDPAYNAARFYLGVSKELIGKHDEAAEAFEQLRLQVAQPDVDLLYNLGLAYFHEYNAESYRRALECLSRVVELTAKGPSEGEESRVDERRRISIRLLAQTIMAQVHSHFSIPPAGVSQEEAQQHFQAALQIAARSLDEFETIEDKLDQALVADIGWGLHNAIGHAYLYAGRREANLEHFKRSISEFKQALQADPNNYRVLSNLGSAHFFLAGQMRGEQQGRQLDLAEETFRRVLQFKPNYDFAYTRLAKIALQRGKLDEAKKFATLAKKYPSEMTSVYIDDLFRSIEQARPISGLR